MLVADSGAAGIFVEKHRLLGAFSFQIDNSSNALATRNGVASGELGPFILTKTLAALCLTQQEQTNRDLERSFLLHC